MIAPMVFRWQRASAMAVVVACLPLMAAPEYAAAWPARTSHAMTSTVASMADCQVWLSTLGRCGDEAGRLSSAERDGAHAAVPTRPDYAGIRRDTNYFLGLQLSIIGVLYFMPESVSGWSEEQKEQHRLDKWWSNVSNPKWDDDEHYINYVLHPYWGAAYYVRARERGFSSRGAFWYSFLLSTLYEGGVEALFEPISIQDFFVTPIAGSWLGGHFMRWREVTRERMSRSREPRFRDRALLVATDPLGSAADFVDRRLGRAVEFDAAPFLAAPAGWPAARTGGPNVTGAVYGLRVQVRW